VSAPFRRKNARTAGIYAFLVVLVVVLAIEQLSMLLRVRLAR